MNIVRLTLMSLIAAVSLSGCTTLPEQPTLTEGAGPEIKNYVIWNKKQFLKPAGLVTMSQKTIFALAKLYGAENMKPLENINGFTVKNAKAPLTVTSDEWVVQEEVMYYTQADACYKHVPIACPGGIDPVTPKCPSPPGVGPCGPVDPGPIEADKSWGRARVHAKEAQALVDTSGVKVCVIDTGIDLNHPNKGNVIGSIGFAGAVQDGAGHGTHTAGTIAGTGGVGVSKARLLICKGLSDSGSGSSSGLAQCLTWCGQQGAQIVSNSWGGGGPDPMINQAATALANRGIYVFFANGNDSGPVNWPAKLSGSVPNIFAVAASDQSDRIAGFSSRGPETKYISPGVDIISNRTGGGTQSMSGTSMATPHVAAICAFGVARGAKPCIKTTAPVAGYAFADAAASAR